MPNLAVVTSSPAGPARATLAAEALRRAARDRGLSCEIESPGSEPLAPEVLAAATAVLVVSDTPVDAARFAGRPVILVSVADAVRDPAGVLDRLPRAEPGVRVVAVTSCPTGIAHTFMAAEGLEVGARTLGHAIRVETRGSVGARNELGDDDIAAADVVVIAADTNVDLARFAGKRLYRTSTKAAIRDGAAVIRTALLEARPHGGPAVAAPAERSGSWRGSAIYQQLMTGVSHMLPFVTAGGLVLALAFAVGSFSYGDEGIYIADPKYAGTLGNTLFHIGAEGAFGLFVPVLAGYIAYAIADRPGLAPGMVGGMVAVSTGSGFFGGIIAGFLAGHLVAFLNRSIRLPQSLEGLKPTLLLPLLGTLGVGLAMAYVVGGPVAAALAALTGWLQGLGSGSAGLLGALVGGMMAFDLGGPVNKAAYTFGSGLLGTGVYGPIAAVMAGGMTPPLALSLASVLFRKRFTPEEREAGRAAAVLGLAFITEGAIPFAARDPLRVVPALVAGSAVAGGISMAAGCELRAPHGGVFVLFVPNAVSHLPMYVLALVAGTVVSALLLGMLKRPAAVEVEPQA